MPCGCQGRQLHRRVAASCKHPWIASIGVPPCCTALCGLPPICIGSIPFSRKGKYCPLRELWATLLIWFEMGMPLLFAGSKWMYIPLSDGSNLYQLRNSIKLLQELGSGQPAGSTSAAGDTIPAGLHSTSTSFPKSLAQVGWSKCVTNIEVGHKRMDINVGGAPSRKRLRDDFVDTLKYPFKPSNQMSQWCQNSLRWWRWLSWCGMPEATHKQHEG